MAIFWYGRPQKEFGFATICGYDNDEKLFITARLELGVAEHPQAIRMRRYCVGFSKEVLKQCKEFAVNADGFMTYKGKQMYTEDEENIIQDDELCYYYYFEIGSNRRPAFNKVWYGRVNLDPVLPKGTNEEGLKALIRVIIELGSFKLVNKDATEEELTMAIKSRLGYSQLKGSKKSGKA